MLGKPASADEESVVFAAWAWGRKADSSLRL